MKSNSTKQIPYFNYKVKYTPVFNTSIETTADTNQSAQSDIVINTAIDHQARSYFSPRTRTRTWVPRPRPRQGLHSQGPGQGFEYTRTMTKTRTWANVVTSVWTFQAFKLMQKTWEKYIKMEVNVNLKRGEMGTYHRQLWPMSSK